MTLSGLFPGQCVYTVGDLRKVLVRRIPTTVVVDVIKITIKERERETEGEGTDMMTYVSFNSHKIYRTRNRRRRTDPDSEDE